MSDTKDLSTDCKRPLPLAHSSKTHKMKEIQNDYNKVKHLLQLCIHLCGHLVCFFASSFMFAYCCLVVVTLHLSVVVLSFVVLSLYLFFG